MADTRTYDEIQIAAPLVECSCCRRSFYMTKPGPLCIACRREAARRAAVLDAVSTAGKDRP